MGKGGKKAHNKSRGERRDDLERKRDERAKRSALRKEKEAREHYSLEDDESYVSFCNQLQAVGLKIREIPGDGNCLFRALADQMEGNHNGHAKLRQSTVQFMKENSADFEPFYDGEATFSDYLEQLRKDGTFVGNDVIAAFARENNVDIIVHQHSSPRFAINAPENPQNIQLHLAYHNGEHYSSLRRIHDTSDGPANIQNGSQGHTPQKQCQVSFKEHARKNPKQKVWAENASELPVDYSSLSKVEKNFMESTNCKDAHLMKQTLEENGEDLDSAIAYILQMLTVDDAEKIVHELNSLEEEPTVENAKNVNSEKSNRSIHLSNRQRKELAKQAKKKRRVEEQKNRLKSGAIQAEPIKDLGTVAI